MNRLHVIIEKLNKIIRKCYSSNAAMPSHLEFYQHTQEFMSILAVAAFEADLHPPMGVFVFALLFFYLEVSGNPRVVVLILSVQ